MNVAAIKYPGQSLRTYILSEGFPITSSDSISRQDSKLIVIGEFDPTKVPLAYNVISEEDGLIFFVENFSGKIIEGNRRDYIFQEVDFNSYKQYIEDIKSEANCGKVSKVVASRRKKAAVGRPISELISLLCQKYPDDTVFLISTKDTGTWIGASPELLLSRQGDTLRSMALAGTRPADTPEDWDVKNIREHHLVTEYIAAVFADLNLDCIVKETTTKKAGAIEHLMTPVEASGYSDILLCDILRNLSPTPALAGYPKEDAVEIITKHEGDRRLYGGYFGLMEPDGDFTLNVTLRCAYLPHENEAVLFAGGGILSLSNPEEEWIETERKFGTLGSLLSH